MLRLFILLMLMIPIGMTGQDIEQLRTEINNIITYDAQTPADNIPHLLVGILIDQKTFFLDFGKEAINHPADSSTLFEIGDATKIFTALLTLELEQQNRLSLDSSINNYLPVVNQANNLEFIKVRDLLNHHSGLPKYPAGIGAKEVDDYGLFANYTKDDLAVYIQELVLSKERSFEYSNTGYALLELLLNNATNASYDDLLDQFILKPIQLNHTFVNSPNISSYNLLPGHNLGSQEISRPRYSSFGASSGLVSSASDLLQLLQQYWNAPTKAFQKSLTGFKKIPKEKFLEIGYGWHRISDKKYDPIYLHTGKTEGFRSYMAMVPNTKTAVVVLSNSKLPQNGMGYYILKMINFGWKKRKK